MNEKHFSDINIHNKDPTRGPNNNHMNYDVFLRQMRRRAAHPRPESKTELYKVDTKQDQDIKLPRLTNKEGSSETVVECLEIINSLRRPPNQDKIISDDEVYVHVRRNKRTSFDLGEAIRSRLDFKSNSMSKGIQNISPTSARKLEQTAVLTKKSSSKIPKENYSSPHNNGSLNLQYNDNNSTKKIAINNQSTNVAFKKNLLHKTLEIYAPKLNPIRWESEHQDTGKQVITINYIPSDLSNPLLISPKNMHQKIVRHKVLEDYLNNIGEISQELLQSEEMINRSRRPADVNFRTLNQHSVTKVKTRNPLFVKNQDKSVDSVSKNNVSPRKLTYKDIKLDILEVPDQKEFLALMRLFNDIEVSESAALTTGFYKAYIGGGNNSALVKKCLKNRGCWMFSDTLEEDVNFVWTQTKLEKFMEKLPSRRDLVSNKQSEKKQSIEIQEAPQVRLQEQPKGIVKQFLSKRQGEYPFLEQIKYLVGQQKYNQYIRKVISLYLKSPKKLASMTLTQTIEFRPSPKAINIENPKSLKMHNHVGQASSIGNKKGLLFYMSRFYNLQNQNPFQVIPETMHLLNKDITSNPSDLKSLIKFEMPCILKPGEATNRGKGITVHTTLASLHEAMTKSSKHQNGEDRTQIVQQYIMPFLYNNRKFDIRVWVLWNGRQAWWYREGYIRTSCKEFSLKSNSKYVHLTNDAVQKNSEDYGKFEAGNKLSFNEFQKYLSQHHSSLDFEKEIYARMRDIARDVFAVAAFTMDSRKVAFGYQLFGLDFMIDEKFKVWLIEANTNPCLETSCSLLTRLITNMIDNVISIAIDPIFTPPSIKKKTSSNWNLDYFRFEMLYNADEQNRDFLLQGKLTQEETRFETQQDEFDQKPLEEALVLPKLGDQ